MFLTVLVSFAQGVEVKGIIMARTESMCLVSLCVGGIVVLWPYMEGYKGMLLSHVRAGRCVTCQPLSQV